MAQNKILIIDDEISIIRSLTMLLSKEGMIVESANSGRKAYEKILSKNYDLILLDVDLPDMDGFEIITKIRAQKNMTPVLFLSGKDEEYNQIQGLALGGDDYITKPFSPGYLIVKIRALLRRSHDYVQVQQSNHKVGQFLIDEKNFQIVQDGTALQLTGKEAGMLRFFLENINQVFTKEQIYRVIWGNNIIDDNIIAVYIKRIREKIEKDPSNPQYLQTVWGIGYKLVIDD